MKISDQQFRELLTRYLEGTATPSERAMLDRFFASYGSESQGSQHPSDEWRRRVLRKIHSRVGAKKRGRRRFMSFWVPLAAAICVFAMVYFFLDPAKSTTSKLGQQVVMLKDSTARGQKMVKLLADGTKVYLNSNTTISYPQTFGDVREVKVNGEAFFEVVRNGKPFIVHSGTLATRVLGTAFNVRYRTGKDTQITLVEGKVNVVSTGGDSIILTPNQQAMVALNTTDLTKRDVDVEPFTCWKENVLFFEHTPLAEAIDDIEEWYDVKIEIGNKALLDCEITGKYQDEPLGNVLSSLQFLFKLDIRGVGKGHYRVYGKGCN